MPGVRLPALFQAESAFSVPPLSASSMARAGEPGDESALPPAQAIPCSVLFGRLEPASLCHRLQSVVGCCTTPFLLLAATCYLRGSAKFYHWLLNIRWLGNYIRTYRERRGVPLRVKILAIAFLWITIGYSAISVLHVFLFRAILVVIAIGVTIHIFSIPTLKG